MCPMVALEEEEAVKGVPSSKMVLGRVTVDQAMDWAQLSAALTHAFTSHLQILSGEPQTAREERHRPPLGLDIASIASILIGEQIIFLLTRCLCSSIYQASLYATSALPHNGFE